MSSGISCNYNQIPASARPRGDDRNWKNALIPLHFAIIQIIVNAADNRGRRNVTRIIFAPVIIAHDFVVVHTFPLVFFGMPTGGYHKRQHYTYKRTSHHTIPFERLPATLRIIAPINADAREPTSTPIRVERIISSDVKAREPINKLMVKPIPASTHTP